MSTEQQFTIAVLPGDGIGPEVTAPCLDILSAAVARAGNVSLAFRPLPAGAATYRDYGEALPTETLDAARAADAILLAAMGDPAIRYPDGTEVAPQLDLRVEFGLYAGVRPARAVPGVTLPLADPRAQGIDFVLIRESTEGLFSARGKTEFDGDDVAFCRKITTEAGVAAVPVSAFYGSQAPQHFVRFCFCKKDAVLEAALVKLREFFLR